VHGLNVYECVPVAVQARLRMPQDADLGKQREMVRCSGCSRMAHYLTGQQAFSVAGWQEHVIEATVGSRVDGG
jgi:hypothetical protein